MTQTFQQPLVIHFIWHPDDAQSITPLLHSVKKMLARDADRPFSRELNIPTFFWNKINKDIFTKGSHYVGSKTIYFLFVSTNTKGDDEWKSFYEGLHSKKYSKEIIPIAIEKNVYHTRGTLSNKNAIRVFEWDKKDSVIKKLLFNITVAHTIYSYTYTKNNNSNTISPLILFLSHCKKGELGEKIVRKIKEYVNSETTIKTFFDKTEIMAGQEFSSQISKSINDATLILFETDFYSASHWCQMEVAQAKKKERPIISIDFRTSFEDRIFPGCSNIPCLHIRHSILKTKLKNAEKEILRVLESATIETLRCCYNRLRLSALQKTKIIPSPAKLLIRPPELSDLKNILNEHKRKNIVYYPEPPVFYEESDWYSEKLLDARTPLWRNKDNSEFEGIRCGISVSEPDNKEFGEMLKIGHTPDSIKRLIQDISRHLLAREATLIYGGDLRSCDESGFTQFILNEAKTLRERGFKKFPKIENYLAWPLSIDRPELRRFKSENDNVLKVINNACPEIKNQKINKQKFIPPNTPENKYIWALSLSMMRQKMISKSDLRICAGGRRFGYNGAMPGVLEEVLIALSKRMPLYLLGGFGGISQDIVSLICKGITPDQLTEKWQKDHTPGYSKLLRRLADSNNVNYKDIVDSLKNISIKDLADHSGLSVNEYSILMFSPFVDECLFLIIKGIRKIKNKSKKGKR